MRLLDPRPWHLIAPGAVVLIDGVPRTVLGHDDALTSRMVFAEGLQPIVVNPHSYVQPVELDDTDAIGNMLRAGLTVTPIRE